MVSMQKCTIAVRLIRVTFRMRHVKFVMEIPAHCMGNLFVMSVVRDMMFVHCVSYIIWCRASSLSFHPTVILFWLPVSCFLFSWCLPLPGWTSLFCVTPYVSVLYIFILILPQYPCSIHGQTAIIVSLLAVLTDSEFELPCWKFNFQFY
jgi:hypothetical protein